MAVSSANAPAKRRPGRPKNDATTTTNKRAVSGAGAKPTGVRKTSTSKRQPLDEITNRKPTSDDEDMGDDFDTLSDDRGFSGGTMAILPEPAKVVSLSPDQRNEEEEAQKPRGRRGRPRTVKQEIPETQPEPEIVSASSNFGQASKTTSKKSRPAKREVIPDTQSEPMVIEESDPPSMAPVVVHEAQPARRQTSRVPSLARQRQPSASRERQVSVSRLRDVSGSRTERGGNDNTALSRKVGELTKKLESLEFKYETLHDVGVREAEANFDKLKKQTETESKAADDLITHLRAELAAERQRLNQVEELRAELQALKKSAKASQGEQKTLQAQLTEAKNEAKSLQAKLAAAKSASADAGGKVPASAAKQNGGRTILVGAAEGAKEAQKRLLKEELYRDLTGLLVMDVKRRETEDGEEDVFDCIQTGRNGSLHFHLAVAVAAPNNVAKTPSANNAGAPSFEDAEFQYEPKLDNERDRDLFNILPDYLTEDICFPRSNAAKFYARVVDCLTKKVGVIEEDEEMEEVTQVQEEQTA